MKAIEKGSGSRLGASIVDGGVNFAVHSSVATAVELCLFEPSGRQTACLPLPGKDGDTWHGLLPNCVAGQHYGYRVHGPWDPAAGLRCNPAKVLLDPYARELAGEFRWDRSLYDYDGEHYTPDMPPCPRDNAACVPKSVVCDDLPQLPAGPRIPWTDTVIYELHPRGYTMHHPDVPAADRGRFRGLGNGAIVDYLRALGISSVELLPVHYFLDEAFLARRSLRNYWGYNSLNFFAPAARYAAQDARAEFREMVNALHDAGMEVILDVVYNHSAEGDESGPSLCYRGLDNLAYYRMQADDPGVCVNDTGCGNTLNADSAPLQALVLDSLRYWASDMGVDGFRFDLAPVLGRAADGYQREHPLLQAITNDPQLADRKLIAEPWDIGPGGYQLGQFPAGWAEWNDRYRDTARRWWRGDGSSAADLARCLHGSSDLFEAAQRKPWSSVNFICSHDGYTLADLVSYESRHNHANGEDNRDGHRHNYSRNYGIEGPTDDAAINAMRRRQRLNLLATLLLSQGTPMLLAGDEFGNSQQGNNNVYAQDNATGWTDWSGQAHDPDFQQQVSRLIALRRQLPFLRQDRYLHGTAELQPGWPDILWLDPAGERLQDHDWADCQAFALLFGLTSENHLPGVDAMALLLNASVRTVEFSLQDVDATCRWKVLAHSDAAVDADPDQRRFRLPKHSLLALQTDSNEG